VQELRASRTLQWTTAAMVASIAAFNLSGISVTKQLSGASRATIDACRTLFIWLFALRMGWERFHMLQVRADRHERLLLEGRACAVVAATPVLNSAGA
jgi:hypothetical protein